MRQKKTSVSVAEVVRLPTVVLQASEFSRIRLRTSLTVQCMAVLFEIFRPQVNDLSVPHFSVALPAKQTRSPGQPCAEAAHQHQIASLNSAFAMSFVKGQRNGSG